MTKTSLSVSTGLEEPAPGRAVDHFRFSDSDHWVGIDASELIPEPLGPRNRDQSRARELGVAGGSVAAKRLELVAVSGVAVGVDSGRVEAPGWRARGPGPRSLGASKPTSKSAGTIPSNQKALLRLALGGK